MARCHTCTISSHCLQVVETKKNNITYNASYSQTVIFFLVTIGISGVRIVVYDSFRKKLGGTGTAGIPVWQAAICGVTAGGLAQWMASPADLVKVQCQMEGKRRLMGLKPRVHGAGDALKKIIMRGGVKSLWKGSVPNVQRAALVNLGTKHFCSRNIM